MTNRDQSAASGDGAADRVGRDFDRNPIRREQGRHRERPPGQEPGGKPIQSTKDRGPSKDGRSFERPLGHGAGSPRPPGPRPGGPRDDDSNAKAERTAARFAVHWLPVEALTPDPRNARVHSARQIARIADSIAAFGFNVPVLADEKGGVLAGHGRVLAARRLGLEEVPTITLDHLTEAERRAFMFADNRLGELASWDDERLGLELEELKSLDLDFALSATGFELGEIDLRIEAGRAPSGDAAAGRAVDAVDDRVGRDQRSRLQGRDQRSRLQGLAAARAGDVWTLGPHRLVCGEDFDAPALFAIDAAIWRWQAVAGESARLHPTGERFDAVARARRKSLSRAGQRQGADAGRELA